jgi:hypothetical protein
MKCMLELLDPGSVLPSVFTYDRQMDWDTISSEYFGITPPTAVLL